MISLTMTEAASCWAIFVLFQDGANRTILNQQKQQ